MSNSLVLSLIGVVVTIAVVAFRVGPAAHAAVEEPSLSGIDVNVGEWKIAPSRGSRLEVTVQDFEGRKATVIGTSGLVLTSEKPAIEDAELIAVMRFAHQDGKPSQAMVTAGLQTVEHGDATSPLRLTVTGAPAGAPDSVGWTMAALPGQAAPRAGYYTVRRLPENRLLWPDAVRRRVEADYASLPALKAKWVTVRLIVRHGQFSAYLDDRLLQAAGELDVSTRGYFRLTLSEGMQLASVQVRPLPPEDARFESVSFDGYVNASELLPGQPLAADALPATGQPVRLGGVPLIVPARDLRGRDHLDLTPSFVRAGVLEGSASAATGDSPRWRGALDVDPARITLRIRNGQYSKLHLLAAADGRPDSVPVVTAQFFRSGAGHPVHFTAQAPLFTAASDAVPALAVRLADWTRGNLYLVTIPLEPEGLAAFGDLDVVELELTKQVQVYRDYPDPIYYSQHGGGSPSGVHIFAATLERPAVEVELTPDRFAHIWTAPDRPSYTITLVNRANEPQEVELNLGTTSHDQQERTAQKVKVTVRGESRIAVQLPITLKRYGYHKVALTVQDNHDPAVRTQTRSLAYLHPDTRERGNWAEGRGPIFGFWDWAGQHNTPGGVPRLQAMVRAGAESSMRPLDAANAAGEGYYGPEEKRYAQAQQMQTFFLTYQFHPSRKDQIGTDWDPAKPAEMKESIVKTIQQTAMAKGSAVNRPELAVFYAEPAIGDVTFMALPEYYGEGPYELTEAERKNYERFHAEFMIAGSAIKKQWPHAKLLLPWGAPMFSVPYLRNSPEVTALMDGPAVDTVLFERLPETQIHQVGIHSQLWQLKQEWLKHANKPWPNLMTIEGTCVSPAAPGALSLQEEADHSIRALLHESAYGVTRHLGWPSPFNCAGYWGESHYGSGMCDRLPLLSPKPLYAAYATHTRQLNRMNFIKWLPTGSATVFCLQYKHYRTGELLHVFWTIRGSRPVTVAVRDEDKPLLFDSMDNTADLNVRDGAVTFAVTSSPCYLRGLSADVAIKLGEPDHSDAEPAEHARKLANLGDGIWKQSAEQDLDYEQNKPLHIRRFPGKMSTAAVKAPQQAGSKALAVHLEKQEKDRFVMPYYSTLVPVQPVAIPGQASHLGLWVKGNSDWGRVVYVLRDAKGQKWTSVGKKDEWNCDDPHGWSAFNFDGWRYLRFELPATAPYDGYRLAGTTWWGRYDEADTELRVELPLAIEKIMVERRTHVIHANELIAADTRDVLLGDLYAEYAQPSDASDEAVRRSRLRMPVPADSPALENPIAAMNQTGVAPATVITRIEPPQREYDGRRCHVFFDAVDGAASYHVWVSTYPDGRGAICLGKAWKAPGQLLTGLTPGTDLYLYVTYTDKDGKVSRSSEPFQINLKDMFPMK